MPQVLHMLVRVCKRARTTLHVSRVTIRAASNMVNLHVHNHRPWSAANVPDGQLHCRRRLRRAQSTSSTQPASGRSPIGTEGPRRQQVQTKTNDRLINEYFEIVKSDAYDRFGDIITDDCTFALMPIGHTFKGRKDVMGFVMSAGGARKHDRRSHVRITNWFTSGEYLCVEYEHELIVRLLRYRTKIDGYCLVFHMRDGKFDEIREYINPSGIAMGIMTTYILRILPLAAKIKARLRSQ